MLASHLDRLALVCPACRAAGRPAARLDLRFALHTETTRAGDDVIEGLLACPACPRQVPIVDGVVVAVADLAGHLDAALRRHDVSPMLEHLLAGAAAGGSYQRERAALSACAEAQWRDREPGADYLVAGSFGHACARAIAALQPTGLWLDAGCATGRATFQLAAAGADLAIGVDHDLGLLRRADQVRRTGELSWPRADGTVVTAAAGDLPRERTGFVCADPAALPFTDRRFAGVLALDLLERDAPIPIDRAELDRVRA